MSDQEEKLEVEVALQEQPKKAVKSAPKSPLKKEESKIDFDSWFAQRSAKIPAQHHREILKADFKARGVGEEATMAEYDNALNKYGIKLD